MNPKQRRQYWLNNVRIQRKIEIEFVPKVLKVLKEQKQKFIDKAVQDGNFNKAISDMNLEIFSSDLSNVIRRLHIKSGVTFANLTYGEMRKLAAKGLGFNEEFAQAVINELGRYGLQLIMWMDEETKKVILNVIQKGQAEGLGFQEIVNNLREVWVADEWRALRIVRTESMRAMNMGHMIGAEKLPFKVQKEWIAAKDHRTRRIPPDKFDHWKLDGQIVGMDEKFKSEAVGQVVYAEQPGDPTAPAGFVINCRCTVAFVPLRDANGNLIRRGQNIQIPTSLNIQTIQTQQNKPSTKQNTINKINSLTRTGTSELDKMDEKVLNGILKSIKNEKDFKFDKIEFRADRQTLMQSSKGFDLWVGTSANTKDLNKSVGLQLLMKDRENYSAAAKILKNRNIDNVDLVEEYSKLITDHELNHIKHYSVEYAALGGWGDSIQKQSDKWLKKWEKYINNYDSDWIVSDYANGYRDPKRKSYEWLAESYLLYNNDKTLIKNKKIIELLDEFDDIINQMRNAK